MAEPPIDDGMVGTAGDAAEPVDAMLRARLGSLSRHNTATVRSRVDALLAAAGFEAADRIELFMGGRSATRPSVEGLTDIDALVLLEGPGRPVIGPAAMRDQLAVKLRAASPGSDVATIRATGPAVTVAFGDGVLVRLLPALRSGDDVRMAANSGDDWFGLSPLIFASELLAADARLQGQLVPVIRLAKLAMARYLETRRLSGYHIETLAIAVFRGYAGPVGLEANLEHFIRTAAAAVLRSLVDSNGTSLHIDDELGPPESPERRQVAEVLAEIGRRMKEARTLAEWEDLVLEPPA